MKSGNQTGSVPPKIVICPTCGGDSVYAASNPFRPFCSERCKNIDFGAWASESFRVPTQGRSEDQASDHEHPSLPTKR
jgi:endogenous inhibitor of DNA gyrase (YacG/DUF329 family)